MWLSYSEVKITYKVDSLLPADIQNSHYEDMSVRHLDVILCPPQSIILCPTVVLHELISNQLAYMKSERR